MSDCVHDSLTEIDVVAQSGHVTDHTHTHPLLNVDHYKRPNYR